MYVSIRRYRIESGSADRIAKLVKDKFTSTIRNVPGFQAYYLLKQGNDGIATVSVFDTQEGAEHSNRLAAEFIRDNNLTSLLQSPPEITSGDLVVHEMRSSGIRTGM